MQADAVFLPQNMELALLINSDSPVCLWCGWVQDLYQAYLKALDVTVTPWLPATPTGKPVTLHFEVRDHGTNAVVPAEVTIGTVAHGPAPDVTCTFDPNTAYFTQHSGKGTTGPGESFCTFWTATHYPLAQVSSPGYADVWVQIGAEATDVDLPKPDCLFVRFDQPGVGDKMSVGERESLSEWLIIHGGDPAPGEGSFQGPASLRTQVKDWQKRCKATARKLKSAGGILQRPPAPPLSRQQSDAPA
jgi:hypothetical protein